MELLKPYKNIAETMKYLYIQIGDSLKFADSWLPSNVHTPAQLYHLLKQNTVFVHDGNNEILQTMQTLMTQRKNVWKVAGAGDCDCFTITAAACFIVLNWPSKIVIAGRDMTAPVHIYNLVYDSGAWCPFDLTNRFYKEERKYKYTQTLPVN